jgi:hypothetical protein
VELTTGSSLGCSLRTMKSKSCYWFIEKRGYI